MQRLSGETDNRIKLRMDFKIHTYIVQKYYINVKCWFIHILDHKISQNKDKYSGGFADETDADAES